MEGTPPGAKSILVLIEDPSAQDEVSALLARSGYQPTPVSTPDEAAQALHWRHHDAAILDMDLASSDPFEVLRSLRKSHPGTAVLVLASADRLQSAVHALRQGAEDYLLRPPDAFELRSRLGRILERHDMDSRIALLQGELSKKQGLKSLVNRSPAMQAVLDRMLRIAPMKATVLVHGESGVGKELVARAIHFHSPRRDFPFIALNCAAMPQSLIESELFGHEKGSFTGAHARARGKFEIAHRGTLFLDEIGELDPATQAKLLRVLEEKEFMRVGGDQSIRVDVRVIAATNADLEDLVQRARFRRDLYYRLKVLTIHVPPLRQRRADIPVLVETFLEELSRINAIRPRSMLPEALAALRSYHWPGNVRELKNILESVLVSCSSDVIGLDDLPPSIRRGSAVADHTDLSEVTTISEMERELVRRALERTGGNRTHSAALLGIGVRTLQRKIRAFGLEIPSKRRRPRRRRIAEPVP